MAFHHIQVLCQTDPIYGQARLQEADIDQDAEKAPVVFGHIITVDLIQPLEKVFLLGGGELMIELIRRKAQARADHRHFHHALVIIADTAPVFRMGRIGAMEDAFLP